MASVVAAVTSSEAYLKLGTSVGGTVVPLRWPDGPIRYFVTNRAASGVSAPELSAAVERAFRTWAAVEGVTVTPEFAGFTDAEPFEDDNATVIGFQSRPDLTRTLGVTQFVVDDATGTVIESDIIFNSTFEWSVSPQGQASEFDVESIAVHEVGHLLGLSHSALGETELNDSGQRRVLAKGAVMFPIAFPPGTVRDRSLAADDIAGMTDIYGPPAGSSRLGSISGRVTLDGVGVFGAHITAFNPAIGELIGTFSLDERGSFVLSGLEPGLYVVRVEPLDDADPASFFGDGEAVDVNFRPAYASQLVPVPEGGGAAPVEIRVTRK
jgi:hypothetical protein